MTPLGMGDVYLLTVLTFIAILSLSYVWRNWCLRGGKERKERKRSKEVKEGKRWRELHQSTSWGSLRSRTVASRTKVASNRLADGGAPVLGPGVERSISGNPGGSVYGVQNA